MRIRINNIECRVSHGRYEIIKWQPNCYYGKEAEYIEDGWEFSDGVIDWEFEANAVNSFL